MRAVVIGQHNMIEEDILDDGGFIAQTKTHQQVALPFRPEADGITFHVDAGFIDTVPARNPEK